jgi:hypothetical protein
MPVITRSQYKVQLEARRKALAEPETPISKPETPISKPQTSLGIWYMEILQKYIKLSNEIANKTNIYRTSERYAAYRAMRFEQFRIATEMYHIITEYFPEVMNTESDIFVSSHKNLVNKSIEISKRNICKVYSPKTNEELEIILAFQDVLMEVDEMLNPKFIYDLVEKAEKLKAEKEA